MRSTAFAASAALFFCLIAPAAMLAQQTDDNGQVVNPQPHTKKQYQDEKKDMKHQLKHNQKADKADAKATRQADRAAREQQKADREAAKANTPPQ